MSTGDSGSAGGSEKVQVFAIVTLSPPGTVYGGTAPVFHVENEAERQRVAMWIARIANAQVHDLQNGSLLLLI